MATLTSLSLYAGAGTDPRSGRAYDGRAVNVKVATQAELAQLDNGAIYEWTIGDRTVSTGSIGSYTPTDADVGKTISVTALLLDSNGQNTIRVASTNTLTVIDTNDQPQGLLLFTPDPPAADGSVTFHALDQVTDGDGRGPMSYQWFVGGQKVDGATGSDFRVPSYGGQTVTIQGTYTDKLGHVVTVGDAQTHQGNVIGNVVLTGKLEPGQVLQMNASDPDVIEHVYHAWDTLDSQGNWVPVSGANGPTFQLGANPSAPVRAYVEYVDAAVDAFGGIQNKYVILGTEGADKLTTSIAAEDIRAGGGNDTIYNAAWSQRVDGGAGLDTYVTRTASVYRSATEPGAWGVSIGIAEGNATLINVERINLGKLNQGSLVMGSQGIALDIEGNAGQAYRLYQAAFDRKPDDIGIGFWISRLDQGLSLKDAASAFIASNEFQTLYGSKPANAEIVTKFYANILHREADPTGYAFWNKVLDSGAASVADVLVAFSESQENRAALVGATDHGISYTLYTGS